jgi:glycosyltransferase involved in cell wall biosynthesis
MTTKKPIKLGVLVSHPIQYFVPVYRELAKIEGIELTVVYRTRVGVEEYYDVGFDRAVKWDISLLDGYRHCFLSKKVAVGGVELGVLWVLFRNRFDALVVHGYDGGTNILAILFSRLLGTKLLMRGDTRLQERHRYSRAKTIAKRLIFKLCDGFLTIGSLNRAYYVRHGVPERKLFFAPFCVNNVQFSISTQQRQLCRAAIRQFFGLGSDTILVLFASKLTKRKRAEDLIHAYAKLAREFPDAWLFIAGSGEEDASLRRLVESYDVRRVRFVGFKNQSELPNLYAAADLFVLPADAEPWGLVVNEVMSAGLPVIVSSEVGAGSDLVQGKGTGIVYPCGDLNALEVALRTLLAAPELRQRMATKGVELIQGWDVGASSRAISRAALNITGAE